MRERCQTEEPNLKVILAYATEQREEGNGDRVALFSRISRLVKSAQDGAQKPSSACPSGD